MASNRSWTNICPECGSHVEILNGDFEFSMQLHKQTHKSLNYVNTVIDKNLDLSTKKIDNATKLNLNYCHDCAESFEIINNDLTLSFQLHVQKHKPENANALSDSSSTSSERSKGSQNKTSEKKETQPVLTSILDAIFHTMPIDLRAHRAFISEQSCNKAICNLCETMIEPIFSLSEHLKTKLHEDNTIQAIKMLLSSELVDQMEFISFYGSNLCCNLCRSKIDLCSDNLHKTVVNILAHNAGKSHSNKRTFSKDGNPADKTVFILKSLALLNPIVNENQHLLEHKMYPFFKCKPCEKQITYSENENEMIVNLTKHFSSPGHNKYIKAASLLNKWKGLNIVGKEKHNFVLSKQSIFCSSCNSAIESNLDQLLAHIRQNSGFPREEDSEKTTGTKNINPSFVETADSNYCKQENQKNYIEEQMNKPLTDKPPKTPEISAKFRRLLQSLPLQFRNIIVENEKGEAVCTVCNCIIPSTNYNLMTHLNGSSHKKKQNEVKLPPKSRAKAKETPANSGTEFDSLSSTQRLTGINRECFVRYNGENSYICVLCGTIIQGADPNSFQRNIFSHIESQDHLCKVQLKEEMTQLMSKHREFLVRELFDCIPLSFQKDIKYIKAPEGYNFIFCEICCLKIPRHRNCLLEHLEGGIHETTVERLGNIQHKNLIGAKLDGDIQYQELVKNNKEIKFNLKYLERKNEDYFCKLCKAVMKNANDIKLLEENIMSHITGKKHKKNVENDFNDTLDKIQLSSRIVKNNRCFLKKENDKVYCTLCPCQMSLTDSIDNLKYNLEVHLSGSSHSQKVLNTSSGFQTETAVPMFGNAMQHPSHEMNMSGSSHPQNVFNTSSGFQKEAAPHMFGNAMQHPSHTVNQSGSFHPQNVFNTSSGFQMEAVPSMFRNVMQHPSHEVNQSGSSYPQKVFNTSPGFQMEAVPSMFGNAMQHPSHEVNQSGSSYPQKVFNTSPGFQMEPAPSMFGNAMQHPSHEVNQSGSSYPQKVFNTSPGFQMEAGPPMFGNAMQNPPHATVGNLKNWSVDGDGVVRKKNKF